MEGWALRYQSRIVTRHPLQRKASRSVHFVALRRPAEGNVMIELLERQKKLTTNQWKLICTANLADLLDFFDFFLIGYVAAALTKQWSLTYWEGGGILLASGLGAVPGAFFWGWLGDKIGRRTVFMLSAITIPALRLYSDGSPVSPYGIAARVVSEDVTRRTDNQLRVEPVLVRLRGFACLQRH